MLIIVRVHRTFRLALFLRRLSLNNPHWEGKPLTNARWEFSCGSFDKGVALAQSEMKAKRRWYLADAPYRALAAACRSRGQSARADEIAAIGERVQATSESAELKGILADADRIIRGGGIVTTIVTTTDK